MKKFIFALSLAVSTFSYAQNIPPPAPVDNTTSTAPASEAPTSPTPAAATPEQSTSQPNSGERTIPSHFRPDPVSFNAKLGAGISFDPGAFWMIGTVEAQLDKFVAVGPMVQYGYSNSKGSISSTDFLYGSFGPRFTIPIDFLEIGLQAGMGFAYRNVAGFEYVNFLYEASANLDFYILQNLSLGLNYTANFLSSQAETFTSALTFAVTGHF